MKDETRNTYMKNMIKELEKLKKYHEVETNCNILKHIICELLINQEPK